MKKLNSWARWILAAPFYLIAFLVILASFGGMMEVYIWWNDGQIGNYDIHHLISSEHGEIMKEYVLSRWYRPIIYFLVGIGIYTIAQYISPSSEKL